MRKRKGAGGGKKRSGGVVEERRGAGMEGGSKGGRGVFRDFSGGSVELRKTLRRGFAQHGNIAAVFCLGTQRELGPIAES